MNKPLVTVGFINFSQKEGYSSKKYLRTFLESLMNQSYEHLEILCLDNGSTDDGETLRIIEAYPQVKIMRRDKNEGFGAHNYMMHAAQGEYYLCTNFDLILDRDYITRLVEEAQRHPEGATFGGTIYRWDFDKNIQTDYIDTTGLIISKSHHFREREVGAYIPMPELLKRTPHEVFGLSGVSVLFRKSALLDIENNNKDYFDAIFFMYKEDVDIAYRIRWAGWQAWYVPSAIAWHDRTTAEKKKNRWRNLTILLNRGHKSKLNRTLSVRNHLFLLYKNFSHDYSMKVRCATAWDELRKFIWVCLFEHFAFSAYRDFWRMRGTLQKTTRKIAAKEIEKFMM